MGQAVAGFRHSHSWHHLPEIQVSIEADYQAFMNLLKDRVMA